MNLKSLLQQGFELAGVRSAKPLSPGSNPGVAFVNIPSFPPPQAPSSFEEWILPLYHFKSNWVESTHDFSPNLVQVLATIKDLEKLLSQVLRIYPFEIG